MQRPEPTDIGRESHAHIREAIRHLHLAVESGECGVCKDLYREEIETLEGIERLAADAARIAVAQAAKHEQLSDGHDRAEEIVPATRSYVEERIQEGPEGIHREVVRGVETEPRPVDNGPLGVGRSWLKDRPRLVEILSFPRSP